MKTTRQIIAEAKQVAMTDMHKDARRIYGDVAADLPNEGNYHHASAHDHVADALSDKYRSSHPNADFRKITKEALKDYVSDDTKESRANERKRERAHKAIRKQKEKDALAAKPKPRRGIGSY